MGITVPHPDGVDSELISAVHEGYKDDDTEVIIKTASSRPGLLEIRSGTIHTTYGDYEVVGVVVQDDSTHVHVQD